MFLTMHMIMIFLQCSITNAGNSLENVCRMKFVNRRKYCVLSYKKYLISILTYPNFRCFAEDLCGIFVKSVIEDSMADRSGCIMVNDQITEVNSLISV